MPELTDNLRTELDEIEADAYDSPEGLSIDQRIALTSIRASLMQADALHEQIETQRSAVAAAEAMAALMERAAYPAQVVTTESEPATNPTPANPQRDEESA